MRGSVIKRCPCPARKDAKGKKITCPKDHGSWAVVLDLGPDPETGKRRQKWHSGFGTKKDAESELARLITSVETGSYVARSRTTVKEFADEWLVTITPTLRPSTHHSYARNLRLHVLPYIGATELQAVDAGTLNNLYAKLLAGGRKDEKHVGTGLSPRTVRYIHTILHRMLREAVQWSRLLRNPVDAATPPRASATKRHEFVTWTGEQTAAFLAGVSSHRLHAAFVLLATSGMRRGEALGLRWTDLDLDAGRASIQQTVIAVKHAVVIGEPKTDKGRRTVTLDAATVAILREHKKRQNEERLMIGSGWQDFGLVFTTVDGSPLHPERFSRTFAEQSAKAGLPAIRLHDLRHGWATLALQKNVHPKVVQERLGHANIGITLDIYSHVTEGLHNEAAEKVAGLIFGAK